MSTEPVSFSHDTVHAVMNQLALIVSYSNLVINDLDHTDPRKADVIEIRSFAFKAASLLGRPFRGAEHGASIEAGATDLGVAAAGATQLGVIEARARDASATEPGGR